MAKKKWQKPKLRILIRSKLEENILASCKAASSGSTYTGGPGGCGHDAGWICDGPCSAIGAS